MTYDLVVMKKTVYMDYHVYLCNLCSCNLPRLGYVLLRNYQITNQKKI